MSNPNILIFAGKGNTLFVCQRSGKDGETKLGKLGIRSFPQSLVSATLMRA